MLSLSLDTWLESFSSLVWALVGWKSAQTLTTHGFSSGHVLASCTRAAAWCCCCHGNCAVSTQPISSFSNAVNRQIHVSADAFSEEFIHNRSILMKLCQPVLGVRFFETVYFVWKGLLESSAWTLHCRFSSACHANKDTCETDRNRRVECTQGELCHHCK